MVRKNSLASDFITSATFGLWAGALWAYAEENGKAAVAVARTAAARMRRRMRWLMHISRVCQARNGALFLISAQTFARPILSAVHSDCLRCAVLQCIGARRCAVVLCTRPNWA